jgi:hypothetical protein
MLDDHGLVLGGDSPGEACAYRDAHALEHFFF